MCGTAANNNQRVAIGKVLYYFLIYTLGGATALAAQEVEFFVQYYVKKSYDLVVVTSRFFFKRFAV
jgi:hypothetical protein